MSTSFIGKVSSNRLTSCPGNDESHLSDKRHGSWRWTPTVWALWLEKDKKHIQDFLFCQSFFLSFKLVHFYRCGIPDGDVFGQERDQAELFDKTVIVLSQEQLRNVSILLKCTHKQQILKSTQRILYMNIHTREDLS